MQQQVVQTTKAQIVMCAEAIIALRTGEVRTDLPTDAACAQWAAGAMKLARRMAVPA